MFLSFYNLSLSNKSILLCWCAIFTCVWLVVRQRLTFFWLLFVFNLFSIINSRVISNLFGYLLLLLYRFKFSVFKLFNLCFYVLYILLLFDYAGPDFLSKWSLSTNLVLIQFNSWCNIIRWIRLEYEVLIVELLRLIILGRLLNQSFV